jgi:hypothetical protein
VKPTYYYMDFRQSLARAIATLSATTGSYLPIALLTKEEFLHERNPGKTKYGNLSVSLKYMNDTPEQNFTEYPVVLKRFKAGDAYFTIQSEKQPQEGKGETLYVLAEDGSVVARANGSSRGKNLTSVLDVDEDFRGRGIGQVLGQLWYSFNPKHKSGGYSDGGEKNAVNMWANAVRSALAGGWYSELVKTGVLSQWKVDQILKGLPSKK